MIARNRVGSPLRVALKNHPLCSAYPGLIRVLLTPFAMLK